MMNYEGLESGVADTGSLTPDPDPLKMVAGRSHEMSGCGPRFQTGRKLPKTFQSNFRHIYARRSVQNRSDVSVHDAL
jgi:hypothetical protein